MITLGTNLNNMPEILGVMCGLVAIVGGLGFAMANRYLKSKERMELISRGMDLSALKDPDIANAWAMEENKKPKSALRRGMVWLGVGLGLTIGYILCHSVLKDGDDATVIYFGCVAIFVGLGLVISHMVEGNRTAQ